MGCRRNAVKKDAVVGPYALHCFGGRYGLHHGHKTSIIGVSRSTDRMHTC
jgi:hypothetical protein